MNKEKERLQWHPAFFAGIQIELEKDGGNLEFENEHQLGTKPKEIDVLVVKKRKEIPIEKNIGKIFKGHNIIEYKSPSDYLNIDDFYKVYAYACFYKTDSDRVNSIEMSDITITLVSKGFPRRMMKQLIHDRNYILRQIENGIYYIDGDPITMQLIVNSELDTNKNLWLKSLTDDLNDQTLAKKLAEEYGKNKDKKLYTSVMDVVVRANREKFEEDKDMCNALREIFQNELNEREQIGIRQGLEQGLEQGIEQGIEQGLRQGVKALISFCQEMDIPYANTLEKVIEKFGFTRTQAEETMTMFWIKEK